MKTFLNFLVGIGGWIFSLVLMFLWGIGIVHSIKKHDNFDAVVSFFPPWGIYRGVESYWHKDEVTISDIDWDKRIPNDIATAFELISYSDDKDNIDNEKMQMEVFSIKISGYP